MEVHQPAGFWIRLGACIIDGIFLFIITGGLTFLIFGNWLKPTWLMDTINFLYSLLLPVFWHGYVVGKYAVGIRIVKKDGSDPGLGTMLLRIVVSGLVYGLTLGLGLIVSAFMVGIREDKRSIHDFIAGTYVTYEKP